MTGVPCVAIALVSRFSVYTCIDFNWQVSISSTPLRAAIQFFSFRRNNFAKETVSELSEISQLAQEGIAKLFRPDAFLSLQKVEVLLACHTRRREKTL